MKIWELNTLEIGLTTFYLPEKGAVERFTDWVEKASDATQSIAGQWESFVLLKEEQRIDPDFFDLYDTGSLIVSLDAAATLKLSLPEDDYELLPLVNDEEKYFLFNLLKFTDCLNKEESIYESFENGIIASYETLIFDSEKIRDIPVFKIPELPYTLFVTHVFEYLCDIQELKGLDFSEDEVLFVN